MKDIFYKIAPKEQEMLIKSLIANTVNLKKGLKLEKFIYQNILGIVLTGTAQIIKEDYEGNKTIVQDLEPPMLFGSIMSSLNNEEFSFIAKEDCSLLLFDYDRILTKPYSTSESYIQFVLNILDITTEEINKKNIRIELLAKKTIRTKLLAYFETFAKGRQLTMPFSYTELADFLAIDRCAMTRELKNLKEEGFIETHGRHIKLNM